MDNGVVRRCASRLHSWPFTTTRVVGHRLAVCHLDGLRVQFPTILVCHVLCLEDFEFLP